ncbi:interferon regulatory factor 7 [Alligator mississippiensis]|uniref:Interferon regulatory factor 7 n=1 Tax=Alligator mississippiensis TaxID=8496 RepID=A0A151NXR6_ALLMI|nr:interferon regulatory factor 7 [Alligator mississippiensis]KYO41543.1 interferon regulatory factor 7 [Alligator mississippiensis]
MATSENEGDSQKLRFGPWLIKEINSNKYEGIRWTNEAHTEFRIPWKHNSRRDITNNDNEIFRAWAIASGKYHPNIQDRARWKTNFRCALCSTNMFVMVEDNSKNSDDPHKVYRIKQPLAVATNNAPATANHILQEDKDDKDKLDMRPPTVKVPILSQPTSRIELQIENGFQSLSLRNPPQEMDSMQAGRADYYLFRDQMNICHHSTSNDYPDEPDLLEWFMSPSLLPLIAGEEGPYYQPNQSNYPQEENRVPNGPVENYTPVIHWAVEPVAEFHPVQNGYTPSAASFLQQDLSHSAAIPVTGHLNNTGILSEGRSQHSNHPGNQNIFLNEAPDGNATVYQTELAENGSNQLADQWMAPASAEQIMLNPHAAPLPQEPSHNTVPLLNNTGTVPPNLEITIYYRGKQSHLVEVTQSKCLFTYNNEDPALPQDCMQVVHFPSPDHLADHKQVHFTKHLLQNARLQLEQRNNRIYARRLDKCKVFWAFSKQLANMTQCPEPRLLPRSTDVELYNYEAFWEELKDFHEHRRECSPDFTIYLCFGQCFSETRAKETKLILVKLVPKFCENLHEMVLREGTSSLNSGNLSLQMSTSFNSLYAFLEQFSMQIE